MIKCIAIDDEPKALEVITSHVSRVDFLSLVATFTDPFKAVTYANEHPIDLVFLDINMPDVTGLELLKNFVEKPLVIFTTAHSEYALESYEVEAIDYLLKPFDFPRFLRAVTKAQQRLPKKESTTASFFFVNAGTKKQRISYDDLLYIEGDGNYVRYHTTTENTMVRSTIKETISLLPTSAFVQIHRSYIVALKAIVKIEDNHVHIGDKKIAIGASYRNDFYEVIKSLNIR